MFNHINLTDEEINELLQQTLDLDSDFGTYGNYWIDPDSAINERDRQPNRVCTHEWIPILLVRSTVYDCAKCGIKKEDVCF